MSGLAENLAILGLQWGEFKIYESELPIREFNRLATRYPDTYSSEAALTAALRQLLKARKARG